jgi:hypothetical protein
MLKKEFEGQRLQSSVKEEHRIRSSSASRRYDVRYVEKQRCTALEDLMFSPSVSTQAKRIHADECHE